MPFYVDGMTREEYNAVFCVDSTAINGYFTGNTGFCHHYLETFGVLPPGKLHPDFYAYYEDWKKSK